MRVIIADLGKREGERVVSGNREEGSGKLNSNRRRAMVMEMRRTASREIAGMTWWVKEPIVGSNGGSVGSMVELGRECVGG